MYPLLGTHYLPVQIQVQCICHLTPHEYSTTITHVTVSILSCTCTYLPTGSIHGLLGGSIGVDGGHEPLNDAKLVVDHFCQRSKAVGGTGGVAREKGDN